MPIKSIRLDPNLEPKQIYKHHENLGCQIGTVHGSWLQNRLMTLSRNRPLQINQFPADIGNPWPRNQLSTHWVPAQQVQSHHQVHAHLPWRAWLGIAGENTSSLKGNATQQMQKIVMAYSWHIGSTRENIQSKFFHHVSCKSQFVHNRRARPCWSCFWPIQKSQQTKLLVTVLFFGSWLTLTRKETKTMTQQIQIYIIYIYIYRMIYGPHKDQ